MTSMLKAITNFFGLDDETWIKHSNPWSVWTRFISLPLLSVAIMSAWRIGWYSLIPVTVVLFWIWINPRFFAKPATTKNWASKAVLGERAWLRDKELPVPDHHRSVVKLLGILTGAGLPFLVWGFYQHSVWPITFGLTLVIVGKLWFLDRMVWIFEDMKSASEEYQSWEY